MKALTTLHFNRFSSNLSYISCNRFSSKKNPCQCFLWNLTILSCFVDPIGWSCLRRRRNLPRGFILVLDHVSRLTRRDCGIVNDYFSFPYFFFKSKYLRLCWFWDPLDARNRFVGHFCIDIVCVGKFLKVFHCKVRAIWSRLPPIWWSFWNMRVISMKCTVLLYKTLWKIFEMHHLS